MFVENFIYKYCRGNAEQSVHIPTMVNRYDHHERVMKRVLEYETQCSIAPKQKVYYDSILKRLLYKMCIRDRYWTYCVIAIGMAVIVGILALIMLLVDKKENSGIYSGELFSALKPRNWKKTFTLADAGVIAFWAFAGISTLQSEWLYEAFWGNEGRYSGFFLITIYVVFYFIVSRYWNVKMCIRDRSNSNSHQSQKRR